MAISPVSPRTDAPLRLTPPQSARPAAPTEGAASTFTESLAGLLTSVDESAGEANQAIAGMVDGSGDVHTAMIALQRAETTLQLTVQVRNKLVQAYQDMMRMPI